MPAGMWKLKIDQSRELVCAFSTSHNPSQATIFCLLLNNKDLNKWIFRNAILSLVFLMYVLHQQKKTTIFSEWVVNDLGATAHLTVWDWRYWSSQSSCIYIQYICIFIYYGYHGVHQIVTAAHQIVSGTHQIIARKKKTDTIWCLPDSTQNFFLLQFSFFTLLSL